MNKYVCIGENGYLIIKIKGYPVYKYNLALYRSKESAELLLNRIANETWCNHEILCDAARALCLVWRFEPESLLHTTSACQHTPSGR